MSSLSDSTESITSNNPLSASTASLTSFIEKSDRRDQQLDSSQVSIVLATFFVLVLSILTVTCNSIILAAFYRYKRLRTASNCLLVSLAVSDFWVGLFMPFGMYVELSGLTGSGISAYPDLCVLSYCVLIALCSVSILVTVAIAVDRLTSLAQPLRYKNIITHSSIERYIAVFWIYALAVGFSPFLYAKLTAGAKAHNGICRFSGVILPPVRIFLFLVVWAPSALILLGCYMYVYLVARAHARAIYTVELSFRNQTQTLALPRYGQTLAVTVGAFFILWLPFQTCMLLDIFCGTNILSESAIWLGLPILAHSGTNPWLYAFHHGDMRIAAGRVAEDIVSLVGVTPSRYGCSPAHRGSNTNFELAEVPNSQEEHRPPIEDCFAAKHHYRVVSGAVCSSRRCLGHNGLHPNNSKNPSSEGMENDSSSDDYCRCKRNAVLEESVHDLARMLDPDYAINRNQVIDSNHNVDKIKSLKYLLDPTFDKIRHLRRLNRSRRLTGKNKMNCGESTFVSYPNLKSEGGGYGHEGARGYSSHRYNSYMSDPMLSCCNQNQLVERLASSITNDPKRRKGSNVSASMSDPSIKHFSSNASLRLAQLSNGSKILESNSFIAGTTNNRRGFSYQQLHRRSFFWARTRYHQRTLGHTRVGVLAQQLGSSSSTVDVTTNRRQSSYASLPSSEDSWSYGSSKRRSSSRSTTPNKLASLVRLESESRPFPRINLLPVSNLSHARLLEPSRLDCLVVPTIHSEPPSPLDPLPLSSLEEEEQKQVQDNSNHGSLHDISNNKEAILRAQALKNRFVGNRLKSPTHHSDPVIPTVMLNVEDCCNDASGGFSPSELSKLLLQHCGAQEEQRDNGSRFDAIFPEHDCGTRFSSRRPSDSRWSESSRSQEVLSTQAEHPVPRFPSSYSVNNFNSSLISPNNESGNDLTSSRLIEPFLCSEALSSSLHESFFSAPSVPDSAEDTFFASFETDEPTPPAERSLSPTSIIATRCSMSNLRTSCKRSQSRIEPTEQSAHSRSTDTMFRRSAEQSLRALLRLEPTTNAQGSRRSAVGIGTRTALVLQEGSVTRLAPLASPTPSEVCTPTSFDASVATEIKADSTGLGVRV